MPVVLFGSDRDAWLKATTPAETLQTLLRPAANDTFLAELVSTAVNNPRNDVPNCVVPVALD